MKRLFTIFCLLLCSALVAQAQKFEVETILHNGDTDKHINFVFLGDGYQEHELPKYLDDVRNAVDGIFKKSPYREYKNYFNVYAVMVPSNESGANHPNNAYDEYSSYGQPYALVDNYFGSTFDYYGIHRLLVPTNDAAITTVLANNFPEYDQIFMLVNSPYYGGSGGAYATSSTHELATEIAIHEIGHSFANLADEYWAGDMYARERPNMTRDSSPATNKWRNWLYDLGVGIYPYEESPSWYRPHQRCNMRYLSTATIEINFCAVCSETIVERIHSLASPLQDWAPVTAVTGKRNEPLTFSLSQIKPEPNTLQTEWTLNGRVVGGNNDVLQLAPDYLKVGDNTLTALMVDATALTRSDSHATLHVYTVSWEIQHNKGGVSFVNHSGEKKGLANQNTKSLASEGIAQTIEMSFYPNPTPDLVHINYSLEQPADVQVQLLSLDGRILSTTGSARKGIGKHQEEVSMGNLSSGTYLVRFFINGSSFSRKVVKSE